MRALWGLLASTVILAGCRDLTIPPPPGPGSLTGKVVLAVPGTPTRVPVVGAQVEVLSSGRRTVSDDQGAFSVTGLLADETKVLFRADLDGDGHVDRQKLLALGALSAGRSRDVSLGDVVLSENAGLRGKLLLGDAASPLTGHAGSLVFVAMAPWVTTTSDDGTFSLSELPEGSLSVAFFREGYEPRGLDAVTLSSGQRLELEPVTLARSTSPLANGTVKGRVVTVDGAPASNASVKLNTRTTTVDDTGHYEFAAVAPGLYSRQ
jgi:hypothetical protein